MAVNGSGKLELTLAQLKRIGAAYRRNRSDRDTADRMRVDAVEEDKLTPVERLDLVRLADRLDDIA